MKIDFSSLSIVTVQLSDFMLHFQQYRKKAQGKDIDFIVCEGKTILFKANFKVDNLTWDGMDYLINDTVVPTMDDVKAILGRKNEQAIPFDVVKAKIEKRKKRSTQA